MLTADDRAEVRRALLAADHLRFPGAKFDSVHRRARLLADTLDVYDDEARKTHPRLSCLANAVRSLTGALTLEVERKVEWERG